MERLDSASPRVVPWSVPGLSPWWGRVGLGLALWLPLGGLGGLLSWLLFGPAGVPEPAPGSGLFPALFQASSWVWRLLQFTVLESLLSAFFSLLIGFVWARALVRRSFPRFLHPVPYMLASFAMPQIVVLFAFVQFWGSQGILEALFQPYQTGLLARGWYYGLEGVVLVHIFYNAPFFALVFYQVLSSIPAERLQLALHLGFRDVDYLRLLDLPVVFKTVLPAFGLVFFLCFTSFAPVLVLGGGPPNQTLEVALYQAMRLDYAPTIAISLALLQGVLLVPMLFFLVHTSRTPLTLAHAPPSRAVKQRVDSKNTTALLADVFGFLLFLGLVLFPLAGLIAMGLPLVPLWFESGSAPWFAPWLALGRSLLIGLGSGVLAVFGALCLVQAGRSEARSLEASLQAARPAAGRALRRRLLETRWVFVAYSPFLMPVGMAGLIFFLTLSPFTDPGSWLIPVAIAIHGTHLIPLAFLLIRPLVRELEQRYQAQLIMLKVSGLSGFWRVDWPSLAPGLRTIFVLCVCLGFGEMTVAVFFASPDGPSLPLLLLRAMGHYRFDYAASLAFLLLVSFLVLAHFPFSFLVSFLSAIGLWCARLARNLTRIQA